MQIGYYLEINLFCAVVILIIRSHLFQHSKVRPTGRVILKLILDVTLAICISDLLAGILNGVQFIGSRAVLKALNLIYFETTTISGFLWFCYVKNKLGRLTSKTSCLAAIPALLFTMLVIIDPFTNLIFSVDSASVYHRGPLVFIHWIVAAFYLVMPTIEAAVAIIKEKSNYRRKSLQPLLVFSIAPLVASFIQVCFYGISTIQVGIVTSVIILFFDIQNRQIYTDELTNLNNRHGLNKYINDVLSRNNKKGFFLMIESAIIDGYGHNNDGDGMIVEMQEFFLTRGADKLKELDHEFHDAVYALCDSRILVSSLSRLHRQTGFFRRRSLFAEGRAAASVAEHRAICEAILRGDGDAAEQLTVEHIENAYLNLLKVLEE